MRKFTLCENCEQKKMFLNNVYVHCIQYIYYIYYSMYLYYTVVKYILCKIFYITGHIKCLDLRGNNHLNRF